MVTTAALACGLEMRERQVVVSDVPVRAACLPKRESSEVLEQGIFSESTAQEATNG